MPHRLPHTYLSGPWLMLYILVLVSCGQQQYAPAGETTPVAQVVVRVTATHSSTPTAVPVTPTPTMTPTPNLRSSPQPTAAPITPEVTPPTETPDGNKARQPRMIYVPGGFFPLGAAAGERYQECQTFRRGCQRAWFSNAEPTHLVLLNAFYIDQYEVTYEAFLQFLNDAGRQEGNCLGQDCFSLDKSPVFVLDGQYQVPPSLWKYPINNVSWYGAAAYCQWRDARLPDEAEWEMAAGWNPDTEEKFQYPWGNAFAGENLNFCDNQCQESQANANYDDGYATIAPIGRYESGRSPMGAYDMAGNVWEWVNDWYAPDYYAHSPTAYPRGPITGTQKVVRGGSWYDTGNFAGTTFRIGVDPVVTDDSIGFRCAQNASNDD
ncbi:MAG: SUMF1/EgtB/PvdO family nonheme iron enzyme [Anaerolineales bacterium]|nr:SUMF1/EgtB/PvdO family nonheme iron enzyme [Anaerolineales bacterium]